MVYYMARMPRKSAKRTYKRKSTRTVPLPIKKYVSRVIRAKTENKVRVNFAANQSITSGDATTCTWPLIISTTQGTGESERVGNEIKIVKGTFRAAINLKVYDATTNPFPQPTWVKIWVVKDLKNKGQLATMDSTAYSNFFRANSTTVSMQNTPLDLTLPINQDYFRVLYSKVFKLGCSGVYNVAPVSTNVNSYQDNSPMAKIVTINWGKWARKVMKFTEGSSQANNENIYFVIQAIPADGQSAAGKQLIEMHYTNTQHYEDS